MRVAVLDDYQGVAMEVADWSPVLARAEVDVFRDHVTEPSTLIERLAPYDAVVLMRERTPMSAQVIEALPRLRLIVSTGRRNPVLDVATAKTHGITVCGTRGLSTAPAELTWALILGLARNLVREAGNIASGRWQTTVGLDLAGRTLGVLGLGRIGSQVAGVGKAFGMNVLAWSAHLTEERAGAVGASVVPLDRLLAESDVVTLHLVLSDRTRGLLGERELAAMKPSALLVNTSRGPIIDQQALVAALTAGRLGGVGLDVYDEEPLAFDHPLRSTPRTLLTPHIGYVTQDVYRLFYGDVVEDIVAFMDGAPVREVE
jgi:phosphoglycerate dehydrogenase-like enzyme